VGVKAIINWEFDPSSLPLHEWLRDLVVITGEIRGREITESWTVLVKVVERIPDSWDTHAEVKFVTEIAPWYLWQHGYSFKLWNGKYVATVRIL